VGKSYRLAVHRACSVDRKRGHPVDLMGGEWQVEVLVDGMTFCLALAAVVAGTCVAGMSHKGHDACLFGCLTGLAGLYRHQ
jgi:hypothetical protein